MGAKPGLPGRSELYQEGCTMRVAISSEGWNGHRSEVVMAAVKHKRQYFVELSSSDDKRLPQAIALRPPARRKGRSKNFLALILNPKAKP